MILRFDEMLEVLADMGFREYYTSAPGTYRDFFLPAAFLNILPGPQEAANMLFQCAECAEGDNEEGDSPAYAHVWIATEGASSEAMNALTEDARIEIGFVVREEDSDDDVCADSDTVYPGHKGYGAVIALATKAKLALVKLAEES
jgi:hypothetical protein